MNVNKLPPRWLIIAGACLAFLGFFLPCVNISYSLSTFIEDIGYSDSFSLSLVDLADGGMGNSIYFIPVCFIGTIVLNFIFHSPSTQSNQRSTLYILEWITTGFGILYSIYTLIRVNSLLSDSFGSLSGLSFGSVSGDVKSLPSIGIFLMLFGATLMVYGLIGDRIIFPQPHTHKGDRNNYDNRQYHRGIDDRNRSSRASFDNEKFSPSKDNNAPVINAPIVVAPPISNQQQKRKTSAWLVSRDGKNYQLNTGETTIGRSSDNDIQLSNPRISKHHAKIVGENQRFKIIDLESTNGTWVNGRQVQNPVSLHMEDVIRFGDQYEVQFAIYERNQS